MAVIYPSLSEHAIKRDGASFANGLKKGLGLVSLIAWPATFALILLRVPVIQLLFERGAFDHQATLATANAFLYFCIGLWPMAVNMVLTRAFYAYGDVKTPLYMGFLSIIVNVILCLALYRLLPFGGAGLAFANSVAAVSNMSLPLLGAAETLAPVTHQSVANVKRQDLAGYLVDVRRRGVGLEYLGWS